MSGLLLHRPGKIVASAMVAAGLGSAPPAASFAGATDWPIYSPDEPGHPDNVITVNDTTGVIHGHSQVDGRVEEHYGISIRIRGDTPDAGYAKAQEIANGLTDAVRLRVVTLDATSYCVHSVTRTTSVISLGKETPTSERRLYTINALAHIVLYGA